jgi:hypothetical protein
MTPDLVSQNNEGTVCSEYDGHLKCGGGKSSTSAARAINAVTGTAPTTIKTATHSPCVGDGV